jgi:hypothetical protein
MKTFFTLCVYCCALTAFGQCAEEEAAAAQAAPAAAGDPFTGLTFYADPASTGGDGTTTNLSGANAAFVGLAGAVTHAGMDIASPRRVFLRSVTGIHDTNNATQLQWNSLSTTPDNYVEWIAENSWIGAATNTSFIYNNQPGHLRFKNLRVYLTVTSSGSGGFIAFRGSTANVGAGRTDCDIRFERCVAYLTVSGTHDAYGFQNSQYDQQDAGNQIRLYNCAVISLAKNEGDGLTWGYVSVWTNVMAFNCTSISNSVGFADPQININCLSAYSWLGDFNSTGTGDGRSKYNASSDATAHQPAFSATTRTNQTFTWIDAPNFNFRLAAGDSGARNHGLSDPASGLFSTDIDGTARPQGVAWDIGFSERE